MRKSGSGIDVAQRVAEWQPMIYRSVVDDGALEALMRSIGAAVGSEWAAILAHPHAGGAPLIAVAHGVPAQAQAEYDAYYHRLDPWPSLAARAGFPFGTAALSQDMISVSALRRMEYYCDFWRRHSDLLHTVGGVFAIDEERFGHLALPRSRSFGEHPQAARDLVEALMPQLGAALRARFRFERERLRDALLCGAFESVEDMLWLVDPRGSVGVANRAADAWISSRRALRLSGGRFVATHPALQAPLRELFEGWPRKPPAVRECRMVVDGEDSHWLLSPLVGSDHAPTPTAWPGVLRISLPQRRLERVLARWRTLHGLTAAEARVCAGLLEGLGAEAIARRSSRSVQTVRSQVRAVLAKTGTHRQAALLARYRAEP